MHPSAAFRNPDRDLLETLIDQIGFGMVFAQTPDGPRVAHVALLSTGDGAVQFHLSRGNALAKHLAERTALVVVNGPDGYVSPRWYSDPAQVPTWNYVAVHVHGAVSWVHEADAKLAIVRALTDHFERREMKPWSVDDAPADYIQAMLRGIVGVRLSIERIEAQFKLSQNRTEDDRSGIELGLTERGAEGEDVAHLMRVHLPREG